MVNQFLVNCLILLYVSRSADQTDAGKKENKSEGTIYHQLSPVVLAIHKANCSHNKACNSKYSKNNSKNTFFHNTRFDLIVKTTCPQPSMMQQNECFYNRF